MAPSKPLGTGIRQSHHGFNESKVDPGIYTFIKEGELYVLALYVDDNIIVGSAGSFIIGFKSAFGERFNTQKLGPVSWLLGMTVERDRGNRVIRIGQKQYVLDGKNDPTVTKDSKKIQSTTKVLLNHISGMGR
jgi:hypothetical protein